MSLANLNINVTANVAPVVNAMAGVQVATAQSMTKSGVSVSEFQRSFTQSADVVRDRSAGINSDMSAMNNGIAQGAQDASKAIDGITQAAKSVQVGNIGKQVNQQMQAIEEGKTKFQEFEQDAKSWAARTATFAGLAFVTGVSAAVFTGLYAAYKSLDFVGGLFTGESYKSKSIDAVIASNKEVQSLQSSLQLAAVDANALNDAMGRLNVDKADYSSVYEKTESAIRSNGDELDRLGIQHKNANGQFLETYQILENSRKKLDEYTDGWDRNQAAAAIGMGSYAQINNYLKLNQQELDNSKARLNDYNLGLGTEGQAHLAAYQKAMREFNNELKLMGDGFKRAWSDQILPAATATATFLKDGWPIAVNAFRYATAQITSLLYGLKMAFDIVTDVIVGDVKAQYQVFSSIYEASQKALTGDFGGAKELLVKGWTDAKNTVSKIGSDIVADANKNSAAMKLAWGFDNRSGGSGNGMPGSGKNKGKAWNPAAATEEENSKAASAKDDSRLWQIAHDKYLEYLKAFSAKEAEIVKTSAQEQLEANQEAWDWGLISQQQYLAKKWDLSVNAAAAEVQLKKEELARYNAEVSKGYVEGDARSSAEYHENLKKQAVAQHQLITLESKLAIVRMQNANEYSRATYQQSAAFNQLAAQLLDITGNYEDAARARALFEKQSPEYGQLSPANQALKDQQSELAIAAAAKRQRDEAQSRKFDIADIKGNTMSMFQQQANPYEAVDRQHAKDSYAVQSRMQEIETLSELNDQQLAEYQDLNDKLTAIDEKHAKDKQRLDANNISSIGDSLGKIGAVMMKGNKEQFEAGKKLAIASATIQMISAGMAAFAGITASTGGWGMAAGLAEMAAVIATGTAQIAQISSTQYEGREFGGPVNAGQSYIVGEKRPELFTPGVSGSITPFVPAGGGQRVDVTQVFQVSTGVSETVQAEIRRVAPSMIQMSVQAVKSAMRGGEFQGVAA